MENSRPAGGWRCELCRSVFAAYRAQRRTVGADGGSTPRRVDSDGYLSPDWFSRRVWEKAVTAAGLQGTVRMHDLRCAHAWWLATPTCTWSRNGWAMRASPPQSATCTRCPRRTRRRCPRWTARAAPDDRPPQCQTGPAPNVRTAVRELQGFSCCTAASGEAGSRMARTAAETQSSAASTRPWSVSGLDGPRVPGRNNGAGTGGEFLANQTFGALGWAAASAAAGRRTPMRARLRMKPAAPQPPARRPAAQTSMARRLAKLFRFVPNNYS